MVGGDRGRGLYLTSVSCPTSALCVATDGAGHVVTSTDPAGGAGEWTATDIDGSNPIWSVSCPSASFCVAVGGEGFGGEEKGHVLVSTNPTGGAAAWTVTKLGAFHEMVHVSCPTTSLCAGIETNAFGAVGEISTSTEPAMGASSWSTPFQVTPGTEHLEGISCGGSALCVAVDSGGDAITSTDPAAGASAWSAQDINYGDQLSTVDCPSSHFCLTADFHGQVLTASDGTTPTAYALAVGKSGSGSGTVTSAPAGIDCGATCQANFGDGTAVTLTAAPATGSKFMGWSGGGCSGTGTCRVIVDASTTVTAMFEAESPAGGGGGR